MKKAVRNGLVAFLALDILLLCTSPAGALVRMYVTGKSYCPAWATITVLRSVAANLREQDRVRREMKLVRSDGDLQLWSTPHGDYWVAAGGEKWLPLLLAEEYVGIYSSGERGAHRGDIVLDCGADIGTSTRAALNAGASKVVAIELDPGKERILRHNFATEIASGQVIIFMKGVWNQNTSLVLYGDSVVEKRNGTSVTVPLTTIDQLVSELGLPRVDFIKMDIEGAEKQALEGARETLRRFHPRLSIATEHLPDDPVAIPKLVRTLMPGARSECVACERVNQMVRPQVMYFY
jgi:FkbM family methyltransferase